MEDLTHNRILISHWPTITPICTPCGMPRIKAEGTANSYYHIYIFSRLFHSECHALYTALRQNNIKNKTTPFAKPLKSESRMALSFDVV